MKKTYFVRVVALFLASFVNIAQTQEVSGDNRTYIFAVDPNYPPFSYRDKNGLPEGYDVDLMNEISKYGNFKIKTIIMTWDRWPEELNNGNVAIWGGGIAIKEERKELVSYPNSYDYFDTAILVRKDIESNNINRDTLKDYRAVALADTVDYDYIKSLNPEDSSKYSNVPTNYLGIKSVALKNSDALIGNDKVLRYHNKKLNERFRVTLLNQEQDPTKQLGFTVKKGNTELIDKINKGLENIKENGRYKAIQEKWFGRVD